MTSVVKYVGERLGRISLHSPKEDQAEELARQADEEWEEGNAMVIDFYKQHLSSLDTVKYEDIKAVMTYTIADSFTIGEWRQLATALGIPDSELLGIEENARMQRLKPLYVALDDAYPKLDAFCKKTSLGHLVRTLMTMQRIDVLTKIQPEVEGLLSKQQKPFGTAEPRRRTSQQHDEHCDTFDSSSRCLTDSGFLSIAGDADICPTEAALPLKNANFLSLQGPALSNEECISSVTEGMSLQPVSNEERSLLSCSDSERYASVLDGYLPKEKSEDELVVFVTHDQKDYEASARLADELRKKYSCYALVQGDLYPAYHCDQRIYEDVVSRADAIIPIVSKTYLTNCDKPRLQGFPDSQEAGITYEIYYHMNNRLVSDAFLCHMIFPVRLEDVDYADVRHHHIFKKAVQLWGQVPKLVNLMRGCKDVFRASRNRYAMLAR